jgi:hypothetical protein
MPPFTSLTAMIFRAVTREGLSAAIEPTLP